jgi:hypothetical protein
VSGSSNAIELSLERIAKALEQQNVLLERIANELGENGDLALIAARHADATEALFLLQWLTTPKAPVPETPSEEKELTDAAVARVLLEASAMSDDGDDAPGGDDDDD